MLLLCKHCDYIWNYQGSSQYATCPRCHSKINIKNSGATCEWLEQRWSEGILNLREFEKHAKTCPICKAIFAHLANLFS